MHELAWHVARRARCLRLERRAVSAARIVAAAFVKVGGTFVEAGIARSACCCTGGAIAFAVSLAATTTTTATTTTRPATGALTAIALRSLLLTVAQSR